MLLFLNDLQHSKRHLDMAMMFYKKDIKETARPDWV